MATILVIEDDNQLRHTLHLILGAAGHTVLEARSGLEGLRIFKQNAPDLVITDVVMPIVNGTKVVQQIARLTPGARMVIMSGQVRRDFLELTKRFGAAEALAKPFSRDDLLAAVARALGPAPREIGGLSIR